MRLVAVRMHLSLLALLLLVAHSSGACPTNGTLSAFCTCDSSYNGILLDCSNKDAAQTLRILRDNQVQLGLIQELKLMNASLTLLPAQMMKGLFVKKLDLSGNQIGDVDPLAFQGLENILQALNMNHNQLQTIPVAALDGMSSLLQLDLSNNSIGDLDTKEAFRNAPKIYDLNLGNNRICKIHKVVFEGIKHAVQTLNLGYNCLNEVPAPALRGFHQLLALHLHGNQIETIEPLAFMNLPLLNLINLAGNRIASIHRQAFLNVPQLRLMYLSDNNMTQLEANQWRLFESLEMLDLTHNRITRLPASAFANMARLAQLYLGDNLVTAIEPDAFSNNSLVILHLPNNRLTRLSPEMFGNMGYLQQLNLKNNRNTFYQMPNLVMLDLSGNELRVLPPSTFLTQLNMFLIDVSGNKLATVPYSAFNKRIMTVVLQVCTERVHMLQNGVGVYVPGSKDIVCGGHPQNPQSNTAAKVQDPDSAFVQAPTDHPPQSPHKSVTPQVRPVGAQKENFHPLATPPSQSFNQDRPSGPTLNRIPITQITLPSNNNSQPQTAPPQGSGLFKGIPSNFSPQLLPITASPQQLPPNQQPPNQPGAQWQPDLSQFNPNGPSLNDGALWPSPPTPVEQATDSSNYTGPQTILPLPVPFLSQRTVAPAYAVTTPATLPPGIIIATFEPPPAQLPVWTNPPTNFYPQQPWGPSNNNDWQQTDPNNAWDPQNNGPPQQPQIPVNPINPQTGVNPPQLNNLPPNNQQPVNTAPPRVTPFTPVIAEHQLPPRVHLPELDKHNSSSSVPPGVRTTEPKKDGEILVASTFPFESSDSANAVSATSGGATTTIIVCLTVVVVVMVGVFVTLCVVRHRNHTASRRMASNSSSASSTQDARTQAYVAAQQQYASAYGSLARSARPSGPLGGTLTGTLPRTNTLQHTWIYTPGSYSGASNYYK